MDFETKSAFYNRCSFNEPLLPEDDRNVDIDSGFDHVPAGELRGTFASGLANRILMEDMGGRKVKYYISGLKGSGKSTELLRLKKRLETQANFHVVIADAEELIDLTSQIAIPEILANLVYQTERSVLELRKIDPDTALQESYLVRLWNWLSATEANLSKVEVSLPQTPAKLLFDIKANPSIRKRIREIVDSDFQSFVEEAGKELELLENHVRANGKKGLVLILDSLEKLQGSSTSYEEVLQSAERVFYHCGVYLKLPVHVLYTIPPALFWRVKFNEDVSFLPMIKVRTPAGEPYPPGYEAARALIHKRIPSDALVQFFGNESEGRVDRIIEYSAGFPREMIRILQACVGAEVHPMPQRAFDKIFNGIDADYRELVPTKAWPWLARIKETKSVDLFDDEERKMADFLFTHNAVLRYENDQRWYALHPAVERIPGVQQALADLRQPPILPVQPPNWDES